MHKIIIVLQGVYFDENKVALVFMIVLFFTFLKGFRSKAFSNMYCKTPSKGFMRNVTKAKL
jgi:hypothetical protein